MQLGNETDINTLALLYQYFYFMGIGDHSGKYITVGTVVLLGKIGRNFVTGMSGDIVYIFDTNRKFNATL